MKKILLLSAMVATLTLSAAPTQESKVYEGEKLEFTIKNCGAPANLIPTKGLVMNLVTDFKANPNDKKDDSGALQKGIDTISKKGGGQLVIPKGVYYVCDILLKDNVHIRVEEGTILRPFYLGSSKPKVSMFGFSALSGQLKNVSMCGVGGRFKIEIDPSEKKTVVPFLFGSVINFMVSDMDIYDVKTHFPMLTFTPNKDQDAKIFGPTNGTIKNISAFNCHYGYGVVQAHCGRGVYFENLHGEGGVTLRFETGAKDMNNKQFGGVFDMIGKNISCTNGNAAVMIAPHSMHNGVVQVDGITSVSSGFAVRTEGGYISKKYSADGLSGGSFAPGCFIKNVKATYGEKAQVKPKHYQYMPKEHLPKLSPVVDKVSEPSPAIAAVLSSDKLEIKIGRVESWGFTNEPVVSKPAAR